ncbi:RNA-binding protein [archaeon]|nr:MAG: RNA-binding protein [archaeon]
MDIAMYTPTITAIKDSKPKQIYPQLHDLLVFFAFLAISVNFVQLSEKTRFLAQKRVVRGKHHFFHSLSSPCTAMSTIKGYRVVSLSLSDDYEVSHHVFLKEHMDKKSNGKILLVGNVDIKPDLTVEQIDKLMRLLFSRFGDIDEVSVSDIEVESLTTSRFAHVTFNKKASVKMAINATNADYEETWFDARKKMGFSAQHNVVKTINQLRRAFVWKREDPEQWRTRVDEEMREFEEDEERERREHQEAREKPDDDGFILVASK